MRSVKTLLPKALLMSVMLTAVLSGCGLSGPLYLEDGSKSIKPDAPDDIDKQINSKIKDATS